MGKWHKIFTLIFVIGAIALIINILFDTGILSSAPENCNLEYKYGSPEWIECLSKPVTKIKGAETIEDCQDVEGVGAKEFCYKNIAIEQGDISICDKMREIEHTDEDEKRLKSGYSLDERIGLCISSVAIEINDPEGCKKVSEIAHRGKLLPDLKDSCYLNIAEDIVNLQLCENIDKVFVKDLCKKRVNSKIMRFAIETLNPQLCENISENSIKDNCIEAIDIRMRRL